VDADRTLLVAKHPNALPALGVALAGLVVFGGLGVGAALGLVPWPIAIPLQAVAAYACFTPLHDASHRAISRYPMVDDVIGWCCGVPLLAPLPAFRHLHLQHHAATNDPIADPDMWSGGARSRWTRALRWSVKDLHYVARYLTVAATRPRREVVACALGLVAIWGTGIALAVAGHALEVIVLWLVPSRLAILALSFGFDWLPHQPRDVRAAEDPYRATVVYEQRWLTPLLLAQNYHLVHHLFPGVPFYRYGLVYRTLRQELLARGARVHGAEPVGSRELALRIVAITDETADTRTFELEVPREGFAYRPGQFLVVHIPWCGETLRRCYSISRADGSLAITVKRCGRASRWLHGVARVGMRLRVDRPAGRFVLAPDDSRPLLLIAGGTGITPIIALAESALATTNRTVRLVYANRDPDHVIFRARVDALVAANRPRLAIIYHFDDRHGRLQIAPYLSRGHACAVYACGPEAMLAAISEVAASLGMPRERISVERFAPADEPTSADPAASFIAIRHGVRHDVPIGPRETLLAAARRAGLATRSSCEVGYCGTCAARLADGSVASSPGPLGAADLACGFILPCSARALAGSPVVVDFDEERP
jgi:ferredoxin-NADP reductase/fatty acid desaturase